MNKMLLFNIFAPPPARLLLLLSLAFLLFFSEDDLVGLHTTSFGGFSAPSRTTSRGPRGSFLCVEVLAKIGGDKIDLETTERNVGSDQEDEQEELLQLVHYGPHDVGADPARAGRTAVIVDELGADARRVAAGPGGTKMNAMKTRLRGSLRSGGRLKVLLPEQTAVVLGAASASSPSKEPSSSTSAIQLDDHSGPFPPTSSPGAVSATRAMAPNDATSVQERMPRTSAAPADLDPSEEWRGRGGQSAPTLRHDDEKSKAEHLSEPKFDTRHNYLQSKRTKKETEAAGPYSYSYLPSAELLKNQNAGGDLDLLGSKIKTSLMNNMKNKNTNGRTTGRGQSTAMQQAGQRSSYIRGNVVLENVLLKGGSSEVRGLSPTKARQLATRLQDAAKLYSVFMNGTRAAAFPPTTSGERRNEPSAPTNDTLPGAATTSSSTSPRRGRDVVEQAASQPASFLARVKMIDDLDFFAGDMAARLQEDVLDTEAGNPGGVLVNHGDTYHHDGYESDSLFMSNANGIADLLGTLGKIDGQTTRPSIGTYLTSENYLDPAKFQPGTLDVMERAMEQITQNSADNLHDDSPEEFTAKVARVCGMREDHWPVNVDDQLESFASHLEWSWLELAIDADKDDNSGTPQKELSWSDLEKVPAMEAAAEDGKITYDEWPGPKSVWFAIRHRSFELDPSSGVDPVGWDSDEAVDGSWTWSDTRGSFTARDLQAYNDEHHSASDPWSIANQVTKSPGGELISSSHHPSKPEDSAHQNFGYATQPNWLSSPDVPESMREWLVRHTATGRAFGVAGINEAESRAFVDALEHQDPGLDLGEKIDSGEEVQRAVQVWNAKTSSGGVAGDSLDEPPNFTDTYQKNWEAILLAKSDRRGTDVGWPELEPLALAFHTACLSGPSPRGCKMFAHHEPSVAKSTWMGTEETWQRLVEAFDTENDVVGFNEKLDRRPLLHRVIEEEEVLYSVPSQASTALVEEYEQLYSDEENKPENVKTVLEAVWRGVGDPEGMSRSTASTLASDALIGLPAYGYIAYDKWKRNKKKAARRAAKEQAAKEANATGGTSTSRTKKTRKTEKKGTVNESDSEDDDDDEYSSAELGEGGGEGRTTSNRTMRDVSPEDGSGSTSSTSASVGGVGVQRRHQRDAEDVPVILRDVADVTSRILPATSRILRGLREDARRHARDDDNPSRSFAEERARRGDAAPLFAGVPSPTQPTNHGAPPAAGAPPTPQTGSQVETEPTDPVPAGASHKELLGQEG
ncbi:unnamed protein product [Amoebophrya sp. A120]|nr:unnamed protein product [Amoebophrya sp. A120]|eukprot:GSA120T00000633001.1